MACPFPKYPFSVVLVLRGQHFGDVVGEGHITQEQDEVRSIYLELAHVVKLPCLLQGCAAAFSAVVGSIPEVSQYK